MPARQNTMERGKRGMKSNAKIEHNWNSAICAVCSEPYYNRVRGRVKLGLGLSLGLRQELGCV